MANNKETKRERFVRVAESHTQKVLDSLRGLSKCYHPEVYEYTQEDLRKIFTAIEDELQRTKDHLAGLHRFTLSEKEG